MGSLFAIDPPSPIKGSPNIFAGKQFSTMAGDTLFVFTFPENWGMGNTSASKDQGHFILFPKEGGFGCSIHVDRFMDCETASEEQGRLKEDCSHPVEISKGFEVVMKKACYACLVNGPYLIQIWYSLPKLSAKEMAIWEKLRECISVSEERKPEKKEGSREWVAVEELVREGWVCHHPNNQLHVLYKSWGGVDRCKINGDLSRSYLLTIGDIFSSGYFYIKWDQEDLAISEPYERHLDEMKVDIVKGEKSQRFQRKMQFNAEEGWALLDGTPYTLLSLSGDGFLFGFALKNERSFNSIKLNDYVKRVVWWVDGE